jgi:hypothetical protein
MNKNEQLLKSALVYRNKYSLSVIPTGRDKKPVFAWKKYREALPTEEEVKLWWGEKYAGSNIALICGTLSKRVVIDFDIYKEKDVLGRVEGHIPDSLAFPIAKTPRGGVHYHFLYDPEIPCTGVNFVKGIDIKSEGGLATLPPSVDKNGRYTWQANISVGTPEIPLKLKTWILEQLKTTQNHTRPQITTSGVDMFKLGSRDNSLFHTANCLLKGGMAYGNAKRVMELLAQQCDPPFPPDELQAKVQSALARKDDNEATIIDEVRDYVMQTTGYFTTSEAYRDLHMGTKREKKTAYMAFLRLCDEGLIEHHGDKRGCFRLVDKRLEVLDWRDAEMTPYDIRYPFELEQCALTLPKNIVCIAGSKGAGKTAFCLNTAMLNCRKQVINYYTSEMGRPEFRHRIGKFELPMEYWDNLKVFDRTANFADCIKDERKDQINIFDFIEVHDNFYIIGKIMADIYRNLGEGVAILAIQKAPQAEYGIGGQFSLHKPRIYLSLDRESDAMGHERNVVTIVDAKNYADHTRNPRGWKYRFKIVNGCELIQAGVGWE